MEAVKGIYREIDEKVTESVDFSDVYDHMSENLYSGTSVYTTQAYFDDARDLMANLAQFANMGGAVSAINVSDGSVKIQLGHALRAACHRTGLAVFRIRIKPYRNKRTRFVHFCNEIRLRIPSSLQAANIAVAVNAKAPAKITEPI